MGSVTSDFIRPHQMAKQVQIFHINLLSYILYNVFLLLSLCQMTVNQESDFFYKKRVVMYEFLLICALECIFGLSTERRSKVYIKEMAQQLIFSII